MVAAAAVLPAAVQLSSPSATVLAATVLTGMVLAATVLTGMVLAAIVLTGMVLAAIVLTDSALTDSALTDSALTGGAPSWQVLVAVLSGMVVGLWVPVLAYRLTVPAGRPARSECHHCRLPFRPGPAGWLPPAAVDRRLLRRPGCPGCRTRLGPSAAVTAPAGALIFGLLAAVLGPDPALPAFLLVAGVGLVLCAVDLGCLRLPDRLVGLAGALAIVGLVVAATRLGEPARLGTVLAGALVCGGGHLLLALLPGSRLGFGDVKLAAVLGLLLGWLGWPTVLVGMVVPHLINGVLVVALLAVGRIGRRSVLPLGPALLVGTLTAVLAHAP